MNPLPPSAAKPSSPGRGSMNRSPAPPPADASAPDRNPGPASPLRVMLAEDQTILRQSLKSLIESHPGLCIVGEAGDGEAAVGLAESLRPDIVVMDVSMPRMGGVEATQAIKQTCPEVKVLALTVDETRHQIRRVLQAGASGYVVKRSAAEELIQALHAVAAEGVYLDPIVAAKLVGPVPPPATARPGRGTLSDRETDILRLIALGYANKEIAVQLNLSVKTVETFKTRSMAKLKLRSRVDIVRHAIERGWLTPTSRA